MLYCLSCQIRPAVFMVVPLQASKVQNKFKKSTIYDRFATFPKMWPQYPRNLSTYKPAANDEVHYSVSFKNC